MSADERASRNEIWKATIESYYECFHHEMVADGLVNRWQRVDDTAKALTALFASGSVVAGWALWKCSAGKTYWAVLAGIVAVISIVHGALGVPSRLKSWTETKRELAECRLAFESFYYRMLINPAFSVPDFQREFEKRRKEYGAAILRFENDIFLTTGIRRKAQVELNIKLKPMFIDDNDRPTHQ